MRYYSSQFAWGQPILFLFVLIVCSVFGNSEVSAADKVVIVPLIGTDRKSIPVDDMVDLSLYASSGATSYFTRYSSSGSVVTNNYTVPNGKILVITSITFTPTTYGSSLMLMTLKQNTKTRKLWYISQSVPSHFNLPSGIVIDSGFLLSLYNSSGNPSPVIVQINGYQIDK